MTDTRSDRIAAYIGLGSNLDGPRTHVSRAFSELDALPLTQLAGHSSLYASTPVGPQDQPDFINAVARVFTRLSPLALLDQLQALEQRHRRVRQRHWGPRTLDLDLLLYANLEWQTPRLTLPHPAMHERAFVLIPLAELAPEIVLDGYTAATLAMPHQGRDLRRLVP
ncbi:2-amino-4-hydroxy-6-hydroxymethyldihydropteridine diphosphokinase [Chromohalobacter marismortui]|uniref:2-amino-4-hydroxy-6-hydroxymethyldihydropteridine pyrophosphokinase n=1 Tax=Chromohalobacter marismortui TaxID=42055 RepID=A0A4R7NEL6_9GAMM|nr:MULTISPECIES: 2-amino-4-hydroxy-6-hydroxymethyldihydropteridine diphosphokinase [Chromohalobacter]MCI0510087.1 2-amino-4-hydroxy-6-hydroxymethyldihydropteridine diphosphokinase [Chromohalobacter sp.]MCI0593736.1 2-amino-4-hydroxy-6-hydroxymethyldihydropteridine diphosphokinase [Chromohalobacter sp.]TDU18944.1 2-amino-4-hydroxy-6-hydroxymethyldihydropteridine diphosphokinase [Chromohalobacter marismortui]